MPCHDGDTSPQPHERKENTDDVGSLVETWTGQQEELQPRCCDHRQGEWKDREETRRGDGRRRHGRQFSAILVRVYDAWNVHANYSNSATCEKQIAVPSNSTLYCSEGYVLLLPNRGIYTDAITHRCRRKDNAKVLEYNYGGDSPPMTPLQQFSFDDLPVRDIIPQRSPTVTNSKRLSCSSFSEDEANYFEEASHPGEMQHRYSDATYYLHQLQTEDSHHSSTPRPRYNRSFTALSTMSNAPSLSHSPTSSTAGMSFPYTPSSTTQRPLPSRINPFSTSYKDTRSIDLVNPFALTASRHPIPTTAPSSLHHHPRHDSAYQTSSRRDSAQYGNPSAGAQMSLGYAEGELMSYDKAGSPVGEMQGERYGSLKQLFRFSEMQAPPQNANGHVRH